MNEQMHFPLALVLAAFPYVAAFAAGSTVPRPVGHPPEQTSPDNTKPAPRPNLDPVPDLIVGRQSLVFKPSADSPEYHVYVRADGDAHYSLFVYMGGTTEQKIEFHNSVVPKLETIDVNKDGYLDIRTVGGELPNDQKWYRYWLFDPKTKLFEPQGHTDPPSEKTEKAEKTDKPKGESTPASPANP